MSLRTERHEKLNCSFVVEGEWEMRCTGMRNISVPFCCDCEDGLFRTLRCKTAFSSSSSWHYIVSRFSEICVIFKNQFLQKARRDHAKHKDFDGPGQNIFLAHFLNTHFFGVMLFFGIRTAKAPFSLQFCALCHCHQKCDRHNHP